MEGRRFIESIRLDRILSFGPNDEAFALQPLNVLIGPNASGKSNLIEALSVLHAAPRDIQVPTREGGGVREWIWKGEDKSSTSAINVATLYQSGRLKFEELPITTIDVTAPLPVSGIPIRYRIGFMENQGRFVLMDEGIESARQLTPDEMKPTLPGKSHLQSQPMTWEDKDFHVFYKYVSETKRVIQAVGVDNGELSRRNVELDDVKPNASILSQIRDPKIYPELTYLVDSFKGMWFFREWNFGRFSPARQAQRVDLQQDRLLEDASNLGLMLNYLQNQPTLKSQILERMQDFYPFIEDIHTNIIGGTIQIFFHEKGLREAIPASRLSDGSLKYLCLLAILLHPEPPNVICIEEPELGLHPDIIPEVAKLLVEASQRSQIFVTTHSDVLVDALSEVPESVVVCEKVDGATQLRRLDAESLKPWLKEYGLGHLWTRGEIGGNRW